ncbi:MAG: hypothetical protein HUU41_21395 [Bryobacteraceae bacterium]|nr:hypothetical protein [Bryobacteraceae bacterium]
MRRLLGSDFMAKPRIDEAILVDEEKHVDWLEAQLHAIQEVGYENYLAQQLVEDDD